MKTLIDSETGTRYAINEDNVEYIVQVGTDWLVHFISGKALKVSEDTAKKLVGGYAKKRTKIQP